jgi:S1-C subfamily serine protease
MKKLIKKIAAVCLAAVATLGLVGCKEKVISAYDIAVKNGFEGTEKEWLASLEGADGKDAEKIDVQELYEAAKADGFTGSMSDFIKEYFSLDITEDNDTKIIAENCLSVVSVCCAFIETTTSSSVLGGTQKTAKASGSMGSGVVIDLDKKNGNALIITNYHVLYNESADAENGISECIYLYPYGARNYFTIGADSTGKIMDVNKDGKKDKNDQGDFQGDGIRARFVGGAMDYDVALLEVSGSEYLKESAVTEAKLGDSNEVTVGEKVFAIGNAKGEGISVTSGVISVASETIQMAALDDSKRAVSYRVIRTDAAINHGNSGGGLFNAAGELIGITNAKNIEDETDNMGYALPITLVKYLYENIQANDGVVERAMLGINLLTEEINVALDENGELEIREKIVITQSAKLGTAAFGKLKIGDVFRWISINGGAPIEITRKHYISDLLLTVRMGDKVTLGMIRDGSEITVELVYNKESYFTTYA